MPDRYFDKFQLINYANNIVVNITERAVVLNSVINNPYLFYPYDINNGIRPDEIADSYYNDTYRSWMVYLANEITDPYYQWYVQPSDFDELLKKKYNILDTNVLLEKVAFYRNNWYDNDNISVSAFNALPSDEYKYWEPVYGTSNYPVFYQRKQKDWIINTNELVQYTVNDGTQFIKDEIVKIHLFYAPGYEGRGQVVYSNTTSVTLQHISGFATKEQLLELNMTMLETETPKLNSNHTLFVDDANEQLILEPYILGSYSYLYGKESSANTIVTDTNLLLTNIALNEVKYWSPVSIYDMENEKNEYNKSIRVLDSTYASQLSKELKNVLK